jgi:hypothetical protein
MQSSGKNKLDRSHFRFFSSFVVEATSSVGDRHAERRADNFGATVEPQSAKAAGL